MNRKRGTLFIVTGPSGAGKGTVLSRVFKETDGLFYSVSATTRSPREGERDGVDYYFKTREQFESMISAGELLEYAEYVGNFYGTPIGPVDDMLSKGCDVVLEIEVQGALMVKKKRPEAVLTFIVPPSFEILERRLRDRGTEPDEVVEMRLKKARQECEHIGEYDFIVINDKLEDATADLMAIIRAERCRGSSLDLKLV